MAVLPDGQNSGRKWNDPVTEVAIRQGFNFLRLMAYMYNFLYVFWDQVQAGYEIGVGFILFDNR